MTTTTTPTIRIRIGRTLKQSRVVEIPTIWVGKSLAVHRPTDGTSAGSLADTGWTVTHLRTGAAVLVNGASKARALKLAKAWDDRCCGLLTVQQLKGWPHRNALGLAVMQAR